MCLEKKIKRMKRQPTESEKKKSHISDRGLVYRTYKELIAQ